MKRERGNEPRAESPILHIALLLAGFAIWGLAGCGGGSGDPAVGAGDAAPPAVVSCRPVRDATGVPMNTQIAVDFSEAMDPATIRPDTFRVWSGSGDVAGTVSCTGARAVFVPAGDLEDATEFFAELSAGVTDLQGVPMAQAHGWSFTTDVKPWAGRDTVRTLYGRVKGHTDGSEAWLWKAIPFARPPVGELRWKAPLEPEPWEGIREEERFGPACTQLLVMEDNAVGEEDCLYLNVWRPRSEETDLPVYVWIHGGGNSIGSGALKEYSGARLARRSNVVVVNVNYRLGPMGWFTHSALRSGDPAFRMDDSGNYGTLDQILALTFVKENIRAFGGNPENVTIAGESAGARNVMSLLISPPAAGLFHGAISQSGAITTYSLESGEEKARDVLLQLLVRDGTAADPMEAGDVLDGMTRQQVREYLMEKPAGDFLSCYSMFFMGMLSFPNIYRDGAVIPLEGFDSLTHGTYPNKVPVILGSNKEEKKLFIVGDSFFEGRDELYQIVASYASDDWKANGVDEAARRMSRHKDQPPVYAYQFLWGAGGDAGQSVLPDPWGFKLGSCHTLEIPFFFYNDEVNVLLQLLLFTPENEPGRKALSAAMMAYAAQFTRTGNPNGPGTESLPPWAPWSEGEGAPKCILWDADNSGAVHIRMSDRELSASGLRERLSAEVPEPHYSEAKEYLGW